MTEGGLAQPAQRPTARRPSAPQAAPSSQPPVSAAPQPLLGNAATARATVAGGRTPEQPGPAAVAHTEPSADTAIAGQLANEVYAALNWLNQDQRALAALRGHGPAMRALMQKQFRERHGMELATYLRSQLHGDSLVRAIALLHSDNDLEPHTRLALALIPTGVRSEEILELITHVAVTQRPTLKALYERTFGQIGKGTLEKDLKGKAGLPGWRLQKSLALLDRDLTDADHLYFNSLAIVGTHTTAVVDLIQRRGASFSSLAQLIQDWDDYVTNHKHWSPDPPWTDLTLYQAMDEELSGEDWLLVEAVLGNYYRLRGGGFTEKAKSPEDQQRLARLQVADDSLKAATTGARWWQGAGTNEAQAFRAVTEIRAIWEERIRAGLATREEREKRLAEIEQLLAAEMNKGTVDDRRAQLLLRGETTVKGAGPADEVYLACQEAQVDRVVQLVTQTWAAGQTAALIAGAATPVLGPNGRVLRPAFRLDLAVPVTNTDNWKRVILLTDDRFDDATRGAHRLEFEIDQGDDESDLKKVFELLKLLDERPGFRNEVVAAYVKQQGLPSAGDARRVFLDHVKARYKAAYSYWALLDLLEETRDPTALYQRALGRKAASETGVVHAIIQHFAEQQDKESGEDTRQVLEESLETLRFIAEHQRVGDPALTTMKRLAGTASAAGLAKEEYKGFSARLERLRAQEQAVAEAIATTIELAVEAALTIATAGVAGGALLTTLAATVAGMVAREALLGQDYTLTSRENAERIVAVFATAGISHLGGELAKGALGAEKVATRSGQFLVAATSETLGQAGGLATKGALSESGLSSEQLTAAAISGATSILAAGSSGAIKAGLKQDASLADKLAANVRAHLVGGTITTLGGLAAELSAGGIGDLTAAEVAATGGKRVAEAAVRGTVAGLRDTAADLVAERREAAKYRTGDPEGAGKAAAPGAPSLPVEYDNVLLLDVTPEQFEAVLARLDASTPAGREVARRIRSGELQVTMTPEGFTPRDAGRATAKEIYVQWSPSVEETASTLIHEATHQADPTLAQPSASRSEVEATARVAEYEFRAKASLDPADAAERTYRAALADAQARGQPPEQAFAAARVALIAALRSDPNRHGVEAVPGGPGPTGPPAAPPRAGTYTERGLAQPQLEQLLDAPSSGFQRATHPTTGRPISEPGFQEGEPLHLGARQAYYAGRLKGATFPDIYGTETATGRGLAMELKVIPFGDSVATHFRKEDISREIINQHGGRILNLPPRTTSHLVVDLRMTDQTIPEALSDLSTVLRNYARVGDARRLWEGVRFMTGSTQKPVLSDPYTIP